MEPKYVTLEQAKWLKEIDFNERIENSFFNGEFQKGMSCINSNLLDVPFISAPEQHQVVEWLRVNHDIWVGVIPDVGMDLIYTYKIYSVEVGVERGLANGNNYDTPQEAYSAAFDYIKNNNLI